MLKIKSVFFAVSFFLMSFALFAGERTIHVDIFLMIDKSQSMNEPGKFDSLHKWVRDTLVTEMLIPEELQTLVIKNENDRNALIKTIDNITPNGAFTDIGAALDAIQDSLNKRGKNNRYKILLLVTDLEQDAPWTSKYRGKQESFKSPYLAEARIIKHDNWYEITLDMDIQDKVVKTTKELYTDIVDNNGNPRSNDDQHKALITEEKK